MGRTRALVPESYEQNQGISTRELGAEPESWEQNQNQSVRSRTRELGAESVRSRTRPVRVQTRSLGL